MPKDWKQPGENPDPEKTGNGLKSKKYRVPEPLNEHFLRVKLKKVS
jgi:hypothetical protein